MTDTQLLTLAIAIIVPLSLLLYSNSRITDFKQTLHTELRELRAEMLQIHAKFRAEMLQVHAEFRAEMRQMHAESLAEIRQ